MNQRILIRELMRMKKTELQQLSKYFGIPITRQIGGYCNKKEIVFNLVGGGEGKGKVALLRRQFEKQKDVPAVQPHSTHSHMPRVKVRTHHQHVHTTQQLHGTNPDGRWVQTEPVEISDGTVIFEYIYLWKNSDKESDETNLKAPTFTAIYKNPEDIYFIFYTHNTNQKWILNQSQKKSFETEVNKIENEPFSSDFRRREKLKDLILVYGKEIIKHNIPNFYSCVLDDRTTSCHKLVQTLTPRAIKIWDNTPDVMTSK